MPDDHKPDDGYNHAHGGLLNRLLGGRAEVIFAALCGVTLLFGWLGPKYGMMSEQFGLGLLLAAYFFGGYFTLREAVEKIFKGQFQIDFLMLVAATGAAILGEWAEGAFLLFLFSVGHTLENYAMGRARNAVAALADLTPDEALVRRGDKTETVLIENLLVGDIVVVRSNERLPADGFVVKGSSAVNQAPITGESAPVDKMPVDDPQYAARNLDTLTAEARVFAGSINGSGSLDVQVSKLSRESTLARVVTMVAEAQTRQSPTQSFTKKFEKIFVPFVIVLAVVTSFSFLIFDETAAVSFYRAMAVLVAASPCALAIATPSAVLSGVARAARGGVLIKGGAPLEAMGHLDAIAFDKTGTLTIGEPHLVEIAPYGDVSETELLQVSAAVEMLSDHPLAQAVVRDVKDRLGDLPSEASDFVNIIGKGVSAKVGDKKVHIGKTALFDDVGGLPLPVDLRASVGAMSQNGRTTMIVRSGDIYLGAIGLMDTPREDANSVIAALRDLGLKRMMMISGDNQNVADTIAKAVGLDTAFGDLMPEDKVTKIAALKADGGVAMVGDGVNDAPAMANATVGIAMGAAGSDVALETADIALMADDLQTLPFAVGLSRQTSRVIRLNLWFSLGVVAFLIPATLLGLGIGPAVLIHEGSTLVVVANALRLLAFKDNRVKPA
ncbi:heavy metal translocating P-type ATPase [Sphingorhabdus sp. YGSMI21]|uniref:heavy metal translocating P-type ATPase n=1 Tax=Sphingorhabdus sp. YGSMI21 TaxID=2077182 RepID=UPI000C1F0A25|nr:heavy metal translocating P-type ATPase [Sphingorhabdus sp. YGSMI21]ATW05820.1 heavy metal translocating P-type ATPase [Sphingorhabdus sp. YGSMI21]